MRHMQDITQDISNNIHSMVLPLLVNEENIDRAVPLNNVDK